MAHYIGDVSQYGHTYLNEVNHSNYEGWVGRRTKTLLDTKFIDLHNNFDFESVEYSIRQNRLSLTWMKVTGDWVQNDVPEYVKIEFDNVVFLKIQTDAYDKNDGKGTLSFIGYLHPAYSYEREHPIL